MKNLEIAKKEFNDFVFYNKKINLDSNINWKDPSIDYVKHYRKWEYWKQDENFGKFAKQGNFFLYEINKTNTISYPKIGIYLRDLPCDQTIEIEWVDYIRTIDNKEFTFEFEYNDKIHIDTASIAFLQTEIKSLILWGDYSILIYGIWDSIPNWKTLRRAYENTWWFHKTKDEMRNDKINLII